MAETVSVEIRDLLTLRLVPGLGPRLTAALLERFGSAGAVIRATSAQLQEIPHIGEKLAHDIRHALSQVQVDKELEQMDRHEVRVLVLGTPEYPAALASIPDPPQLLYVRGSLNAQDAKAVAVVGSRSCTAYGRRITERLAQGLAQAGYTIVSGLAR